MAAAVNSQRAREGRNGGSGPLPLLPKFISFLMIRLHSAFPPPMPTVTPTSQSPPPTSHPTYQSRGRHGEWRAETGGSKSSLAADAQETPTAASGINPQDEQTLHALPFPPTTSGGPLLLSHRSVALSTLLPFQGSRIIGISLFLIRPDLEQNLPPDCHLTEAPIPSRILSCQDWCHRSLPTHAASWL